jgi:GTPase SAR1 family protein
MLKFGDYMSFIGRRDAEFVDFIPGMDKELPEGGYNVWEPDWVDTVPYQTSTLFNRFFLRWYDAFFHKPKQREEVRLWIAHLFLCPSIRHEIMLVLWGSGGSGKSLLLEHFIPRSISYNRRWCREWSHIGQRFDDSLRNSQYVYAAEIYSNEMTHTAMSAYLKKMTTQDTIRGEVKGGGYYEMKNLSGKAMSLNCSHRIDIEYGNRRVFFPDIPKDTDNYPSHPIRLMAKELWEVYEHSTEDNKKELLGAFRSWVEDAGERVHERYVNINMRTDSARELAGSANPAEYLATDFLESIPDWFTPDIIATNHLRVFPQFKELSINEWNSIMQRNKSVLIPVASGKTYKIADGIVPRFRIIRNAQKWLDPNSDAVREQYKLADQQITQALNTRKF